MAVTARTWVEGEVATASKFNTIRDDLLELDAVAGFFNAQYGSITIVDTTNTNTATVSTMSTRAIVHFNGSRQSYATGDIGATVTKLSATQVQASRAGTSGTTIVSFVIEDPRG